LNKYCNHSKAFELWKYGLNNRMFIPQFHGREHFNIPKWMRALQREDKEICFVFDLGMVGVQPKEQPKTGNKYVISYDIESHDDLTYHQNSIEEGLELFERIWGFKSKSFIAPCYIWSKQLEPVLKNKKIELIQGSLYQYEPRIERKRKKIMHYSGEKNQLGQRYNVRNCSFEPVLDSNLDWIDVCLNQIQTAFRWHKPAVITSHRVNYVGTIDESNRDRNLLKLKELLIKIKNNWPDIEFTSSDKLIDLLYI